MERKILWFRYRTDVQPGDYPFTEVFEGIERSPVIEKLFPDGKGLAPFLAGVKIKFTKTGTDCLCTTRSYISMPVRYFKRAPKVWIYLDILHELIHKLQLVRGEEIVEKSFDYPDRPSELEAYRATVKEGRRLGMDLAAIKDYLHVTWLTKRQNRKLVVNLGLER